MTPPPKGPPPDEPPQEPKRPRDLGTRVIAQGARTPAAAAHQGKGAALGAETELGRWARAMGATPEVRLASAADPSIDRARYVPLGPLGTGGVGEVELVLDRDLGRTVARKRLRAEHRADPLLLQAFLEEAVVTGALEHPGIVPVHDIGVSPVEGAWYTMKRLAGEPLAAILSRLRRRDPETLRRWPLPRRMELFVQVLRAVAHAHQAGPAGIIHCDLKPANILVGTFGEVTVVDWGLARVLGAAGAKQARGRMWSGSPGYMAPEQASSSDVSKLGPPADIWALGAILYELLTLTIPQANLDGSVPDDLAEGGQTRRIVSVRERRSDAPPELAALADRALSVDPGARHPSVVAFMHEVEAWLVDRRELERQEARITEALRTARDALETAAPVEGAGHDATLLACYQGAAQALTDGLAAAAHDARLLAVAADLYWRVFRNLHPGPAPAAPEIRRGAATLLDALAKVAPPVPSHSTDTRDDPWIEALEAVAGDEAPHLRELVLRVRLLRATDVFADLGGHELVPVAEALRPLALAAGETAFEAGDEGDALYLLAAGEVHVLGGGRILSTALAPACFGEIALVADRAGRRQTRTATVRAATDASCYRLHADAFDRLVRQHGVIALGVMRVLADRLRVATLRELAPRAAGAT